MADWADRAAIENLLGLYCRAIDRLDVELLKSVYHPDGVDDHGAISANAHEFAERVIAMLRESCVSTIHTVTHSVIDVHDVEATSESYYLAIHTIAADEAAIGRFFGATYLEEQRAARRLDRRHEYVCAGRYLDRLAKRDGVWRIARRKMTNEWGVCRPEQTVTEGVPGAFSVTGSRDRDDPVYHRLFGG
jgi:hypothetical protein